MENKLKSIFDIEFGTSKEAVKEIAEKKNGKIDQEHSSEELLIFDGINYAGYDTDFICFQFVNDKLARTTVNISERSDIDMLFRIYEDLKNKLNAKYFKTDKVYEFYEQPYDKDDLKALKAQGIESGLVEFSNFWMFGNDSICLEISKDLIVKVNFENDDLISEGTKKKFNSGLDNM